MTCFFGLHMYIGEGDFSRSFSRVDKRLKLVNNEKIKKTIDLNFKKLQYLYLNNNVITAIKKIKLSLNELRKKNYLMPGRVT